MSNVEPQETVKRRSMDFKSYIHRQHGKCISVPDLNKLKKEWDTYQQSDTLHELTESKLQIDVLNIRMYTTIKHPQIRLKMGPAQYNTSKSNTSTGDWNEGFVFLISYHAQLFNTIEFDLYDKPYEHWPTVNHIGKAKLKISSLAGKDDIFVTFLPVYEYRTKHRLPTNFQNTFLGTDMVSKQVLDQNIGDLCLIGSIQVRIRYHYQAPVTVDHVAGNVLADDVSTTHPETTLEEDLPPLNSTKSRRGTSYGRVDLVQDESVVNDIFNHRLSHIMSAHIPGGSSTDSLQTKKSSVQRKKLCGMRRKLRPTNRKMNWLASFIIPARKLPTSSRGKRYGFSQNDSDDNSKFNPEDDSSTSSSSLSSSAPVKDKLRHGAHKKAQHIIDSVNFGDRNFASQWMNDSFDDVAIAHPMMDTLVGLVVSKQTQAMVRAIIKTANAFGQGFRVTGIKLIRACMLVQRFYESLPKTVASAAITQPSVIDNACHYFAYAVIAYGWRGLCYLGAYGQYMRGLRDRRSNRLAILRYLHLHPEELLGYEYALRKGASFQPSYFVAWDKRRHTIVLSIRGTWSLYDAITDLVCEYMPWKGGLVHSGMLASAQWFYTNIIPQIFRYIHHHHTDLTRFVITGHSLGGGTASLLTMMVADHMDELRTLAKNPTFDLHCYSYAPSAVCSHALGVQYEDYISSFVCQDDIVGRLSYGSAMKLKELILVTITAYNTLGGFRKTLSDKKARDVCFNIIRQRRDELNSKADSMYPSLYIPGQIIHIQRTKNTEHNGHKNTYSLHYAVPEVSNEMKLTKTCLEDHMISAYQDTFVSLRALYPSPFADAKQYTHGQ